MESKIFGPASYGSRFIPEAESLLERETPGVLNLYDRTSIISDPDSESAVVDVSQSFESDEAQQAAEEEMAENTAYVGVIKGTPVNVLCQVPRNYYGPSVAPMEWEDTFAFIEVPSEAFDPTAREVLRNWDRTIKAFIGNPFPFDPYPTEWGKTLIELSSEETDVDVIEASDTNLFDRSGDGGISEETPGFYII